MNVKQITEPASQPTTLKRHQGSKARGNCHGEAEGRNKCGIVAFYAKKWLENDEITAASL